MKSCAPEGHADAGFTLIEVLFAFALLATVSAALTTSLLQALHARATSRDLLVATQLASDAIEQMRLGLIPGQGVDRRFERQVHVTAIADMPSINRIEVSVSWNDGQSRQIHLTTLLPSTANAALLSSSWSRPSGSVPWLG